MSAAADTLSADEKRRLLRERRQAKMNTKATDRLNTILTSGSSVKETVSPLDKKTPATTSSASGSGATTPSPSTSAATDSTSGLTPSHSHPQAIQSLEHHADPEDIDISLQQPPSSEDLDEMLNKLFGAGAGAGAPGAGNPFGGDAGADGAAADPFAMMMKMLNDPSGGGFPGFDPSAFPTDPAASPQVSSYQVKLQAYHSYQQKKIKNTLLLVRYTVTLINFIYHYVYSPSTLSNPLQSSSYAYVRESTVNSSSFFSWFITCEVAILATYFIVMSNKKYVANDGNLILKGLSLVSMIAPQVQQFRPLISRFLSYWELLGMLIGDIALVTLLFGFISYLG